jgi:O-antigen/teichoic acid export membrane protein
MCYVFIQFVMLLNLYIYIKIKIDWISIGLKPVITYASFHILKLLIKPAFAFLVLPLGYALRTQVPVFLLGTLFGPATIVIYSTARTITNIGTQSIGVLNKVITPEYALAYGSGNMKMVKSLHYNSCKIVIVLSVLISVFLFSFGKEILHFWTNQTIGFNSILFSSFLVSMMLSSLWSTSSFLAYSINQHTKQSLIFLMSSILSCIATYVLILSFSFSAAAIGLVLGDIIMLYYVFTKNKAILNESTSTFLQNIFKFPSLKMGYK